MALTALFIVLLLPFALGNFALYSLTLSVPNQLSIFSGNSSGYLTFVKQISTGGDGIAAGQPGIESQNQLVVYGNYIFAVNTGSDSVSMFSIDPTDGTNVKLINTAPSGGDWPLSVTAHGNLACVANGGQNDILRCFTFNSSGLFVLANSDRSFGLNLTTPPVVHTGPAQVSFLPDGSGLVVAIKAANPPVLLYTVSGTTISNTPAQSAVMGMVPFGFEFDTDGTMVLTDAAPTGGFSGVNLLTLNTGATPSATFVLSSYFLIPNQNAACWVVRSPTLGHFFVSNSASSDVSELSRKGNDITVVKDYSTGTGTTPTDMAVATLGGADYLYVQSDGTQLFVYSLAGGSGSGNLIQTVDMHATGTNGAGVALYVVAKSSTSSSSAATSVLMSWSGLSFVVVLSMILRMF